LLPKSQYEKNLINFVFENYRLLQDVPSTLLEFLRLLEDKGTDENVLQEIFATEKKIFNIFWRTNQQWRDIQKLLDRLSRNFEWDIQTIEELLNPSGSGYNSLTCIIKNCKDSAEILKVVKDFVLTVKSKFGFTFENLKSFFNAQDEYGMNVFAKLVNQTSIDIKIELLLDFMEFLKINLNLKLEDVSEIFLQEEYSEWNLLHYLINNTNDNLNIHKMLIEIFNALKENFNIDSETCQKFLESRDRNGRNILHSIIDACRLEKEFQENFIELLRFFKTNTKVSNDFVQQICEAKDSKNKNLLQTMSKKAKRPIILKSISEFLKEEFGFEHNFFKVQFIPRPPSLPPPSLPLRAKSFNNLADLV
jgi:hypothetical protein